MPCFRFRFCQDLYNGISNLQRRKFRVRPKILEDRHVKAYLNELQEKYVLVPADKAGNNIIICMCISPVRL